jgi:hypothetical protein
MFGLARKVEVDEYPSSQVELSCSLERSSLAFHCTPSMTTLPQASCPASIQQERSEREAETPNLQPSLAHFLSAQLATPHVQLERRPLNTKPQPLPLNTNPYQSYSLTPSALSTSSTCATLSGSSLSSPAAASSQASSYGQQYLPSFGKSWEWLLYGEGGRGEQDGRLALEHLARLPLDDLVTSQVMERTSGSRTPSTCVPDTFFERFLPSIPTANTFSFDDISSSVSTAGQNVR